MADSRAKGLSALIDSLRVAPGSKVELPRDRDPGFTAGLRKKDGAEHLQLSLELLAEYQERLAAQNTQGLLVVLQGIDASGKDGIIRHVMSGLNPQGVSVQSFKVPSEEERKHDFLWRYQRHLPSRGQIGIFNRSHYEEVLVVRVHPEELDRERLPAAHRTEDIWHRRYHDINDWERHLAGNGFTVLKCFLQISREEQRVRFLKRLDVPAKTWKFSPSDVAERAFWEDYQRAFSDMLTHTSTPWAPWYVIPADHKWFARLAVSSVLVHALVGIDPRFPSVDGDALRALLQARARLEAEAPDGAARDPFAVKHGT